MSRTLIFETLLSLGASFLIASSTVKAAPHVFTIDPTRSHLNFALESSPGSPFTSAQFSGANSTSLSGTQIVDITGSNIKFISTGNVQFAAQSSPVAPAFGGGYPGSAAGQYGLLAQIPGAISGPGPGGTGLIGARGFVGDATSGAIPLVGTTFDASQIVPDFTAGSLDYNLSIFSTPYQGSLNVGGNAPNNELTGGSLTNAGGIYTLTIPIFIESPVTVAGYTAYEQFSGQVVATAAVPEPSTIVLGALGTVGLAFAVVRGRRRSR